MPERGRPPDLVIVGQRVVTPAGTRPAAITIRQGLIVGLTRPEEAPRCENVHDAGDAIVMPGLVDVHVHVNEPGRPDWEGIPSATRAAAAGGVTTIVDMPFHAAPATTDVDALRLKMALVEGRAYVDVGFWAGLVPGSLGGAQRMLDAGALGFKCCLVPCGSDDFRELTAAELRVALPVLRDLGAPLLVHAELPAPIEEAWDELAREGADARVYDNYLRARPAAAENEAVQLLLDLAAEFGAPVHITHYSSADTLRTLRHARAAGVPVTVETAPHYLCFAAEEIPDGATEFKTAPPIRGVAHREGLWEALGDGSIDMIASDHSPAPPAVKLHESGDFAASWGGIAAIQQMLPAVWTEARVRGFSPHHLAEWLCAAPAVLAGVAHRKGSLKPGQDADIVVWDPDAEFMVEPHTLEQRHKLTPFAGLTLHGVVQTTWLRGEKVWDAGAIRGEARGRVLKRRLA
jgi:allantoinase